MLIWKKFYFQTSSWWNLTSQSAILEPIEVRPKICQNLPKSWQIIPMLAKIKTMWPISSPMAVMTCYFYLASLYTFSLHQNTRKGKNEMQTRLQFIKLYSNRFRKGRSISKSISQKYFVLSILHTGAREG